MKGEEEEAKFSHKSRTGFICKETHRSRRRRRRLLRCERNGMLFYIEEGSEWHSSHNNKKSKAANKTELWNSFCMWMCLLLPSIHRIQNSSSNLIEILLKFQPFWWTYTKKTLNSMEKIPRSLSLTLHIALIAAACIKLFFFLGFHVLSSTFFLLFLFSSHSIHIFHIMHTHSSKKVHIKILYFST